MPQMNSRFGPRKSGSSNRHTDSDGGSDLDHETFGVPGRFAEPFVASRIADDPRSAAVVLDDIVVGAMEVPVDPDVGMGEQGVVVVAETCCSRAEPVPRIGRTHRRPGMGHDDRRALERPGEFSCQPLAVAKCQHPNLGGVQRSPVPCGAHVPKVPFAEGHALGSAIGSKQVVVPPSGCTDNSNAPSLVDQLDGSAIEKREAEIVASLLEFFVTVGEVGPVVLVVPGNEDQRHRPIPKCFERFRRMAHIACDDGEFGVRCRTRSERTGKVEVKVGEHLDVHPLQVARLRPDHRAEPGRIIESAVSSNYVVRDFF